MQLPEKKLDINPLVLGTWFALGAGLADAGLYFVTSVVLHRYVHLSPHLVWISPVSSIVMFAAPGVILWALARWRPARYWTFVTVAVFAFLAAWGLSTYATRVHAAAALVLAIGIAIQTARSITAHPRGTRTLVRYTLPAMAAISIIGGLALTGRDRFAERRALAALPPAAQGSPNILLIILDTVRAASMSVYGYARKTTPILEQFAKGSVTFDAAISASPWTLPSHGTMFTGRWPHELNADWRAPLDTTHPTLAEVLAESGYATAGFVANRYYAGRESGLERGFQHYDDRRFSAGWVLSGSALGRSLIDRTPLLKWIDYRDEVGRKRAVDVNAEVLDWLDDRDARERPFFVFLNYFDAHDPYMPPAPFNTLFDKQVFPVHSGMNSDSVLTESGIVSETAAYDESLAALDRQIGLLFAELSRRGALQNTIVVVTSDHGEELGEHGMLRHGKSLYIQELHVPLIVSFGNGVPVGTRMSKPVSLRDLPTTIIDLARVPNQSAKAAPALAGRSLTRFWTDDPYARTEVDTVISEVRHRANRPRREPVGRGDMASIVDNSLHLIRAGDGGIEMYQIDADPLEHRNLSARPEMRNTVQSLSAILRALVPVGVRH